MDQNRLMNLYLLAVYPMLLFVLYFITSKSLNPVPFSDSAFIQPFVGSKATLAFVLTGAMILSLASKYLIMYPKASKDPKQHMILFAMSEVPALMGFVIGFLNYNFWVALPFFGISLIDYAYTYLRLYGSGNDSDSNNNGSGKGESSSGGRMSYTGVVQGANRPPF